jgi:diaminohydroxyphosphoribosylaminopyrimidine deaminase/5-amino-6-(5-phosphoribosylamino)uracil reductase
LGDRPRWRVVADSLLRTPLGSQIVRQAGAHALILLASPAAPAERARLLQAAGVTILQCGTEPSGRLDLVSGLRRLSEIGLTSVLSEGGSQMAGALLRAGLVDRLAWHRAPLLLGDAGLPAVQGLGIERLADAIRLRFLARQEYAEDVLETYDVLTPKSGRELATGTVSASSSGTSA